MSHQPEVPKNLSFIRHITYQSTPNSILKTMRQISDQTAMNQSVNDVF